MCCLIQALRYNKHQKQTLASLFFHIGFQLCVETSNLDTCANVLREKIFIIHEATRQNPNFYYYYYNIKTVVIPFYLIQKKSYFYSFITRMYAEIILKQDTFYIEREQMKIPFRGVYKAHTQHINDFIWRSCISLMINLNSWEVGNLLSVYSVQFLCCCYFYYTKPVQPEHLVFSFS